MNISKNEIIPECKENNIILLKECLSNYTIKEIAIKLNICVGTIKRWVELNNVPIQYTFDIYNILSKDIDYSKYTYSLKDQFFTSHYIADKCWNIFKNQINLNIDEYQFIEPSAGNGSFMNILPKNTIGIDIEPRANNIEQMDYLKWHPLDMTKKYIVFGNPPFGLRGHIALKFINHSYKFADYVCFILPQLFESDGKGSPRKRIKGYNLIYSEKISSTFYNPDNQEIKINCVFQIWSKYTIDKKYDIQTYKNDAITVLSLSDGGTISTTRNKEMIGKCDIYLPSTCFGKENIRIYKSFEELPNKKGYGIVFKDNKEEMIIKTHNIDWSSISFLSTNSAYNLRTSLILQQFM